MSRSKVAASKKPKVQIVAVGVFGAKALEQLKELIAPQSGDDHLRAIKKAALKLFPKIPPAPPAARFTKVSAAGALLPDTATDWEGVYDSTTKLVWGRRLLVGERAWADAVKVAGQATLCGAPARAPTIQERLSIVDYDRSEPALDTNYFEPSETSAWEWTSTPAKSPSVYAWLVGLGYGYSDRNSQGAHGHVRAVRAGQF